MTAHLGDVDFDQMYEGQVPENGFLAAGNKVPWDIGGPQPVLVDLERAGGVRSDVLDAGCGLGDNSLFLAGRGYRVTGFDVSRVAIEQARERAAAADAELAPQFEVADATSLEGLEPRYSTVLDSALYHCLDDQQRRDYAAALHRVTRPEATLHLFCVADIDAPGIRMPMVVTRDNLEANLSAHWDIGDISLTRYTTCFTRDTLAELGDDTGQAGFAIDLEKVETDDTGQVLLPVWALRATRK